MEIIVPKVRKHCPARARALLVAACLVVGALSSTAQSSTAQSSTAQPAITQSSTAQPQLGCPAPLPASLYATRCTGGVISLASGEVLRDCAMGERPAIPMAKEIKRLVEKLRCEVGDTVVVTSGYRSPRHNEFLRAWVAVRQPKRNTVSSKSRHTRGRAVDFYVKGYDYSRLMTLAAKLKRWAGKLPHSLRGSRESVWIKVYRKTEGREPDNLHDFPYIHLELRS